jgi:hypothetical protein
MLGAHSARAHRYYEELWLLLLQSRMLFTLAVNYASVRAWLPIPGCAWIVATRWFAWLPSADTNSPLDVQRKNELRKSSTRRFWLALISPHLSFDPQQEPNRRR